MMSRAVTRLRRSFSMSSVRCCKYGDVFTVHPAVSRALAEAKPVVALESTIITHGMPYPHNLSTAKEVEAIVWAEGAIPATVGVLNGKIHVGLSSEELEFLSQSKTALKVSRRDLPYVVSQGLSGGTTVSGTMVAAHRAGISIFVTGGIGGVHKDGENSMDISADLMELSRTPVAVVSAGVKSILDIGRTLEFLETQGVCVATYGKTKNFPAFFSPESGFTSPYNVSSAEEAAALIEGALSLGLQSGLLLAVPIPEEQAAVGQQMEGAVATAVAEASSRGVIGRDVTPFILERVCELTQGQSLQANIALIHNNARVGSQIACALAQRQAQSRQRRRGKPVSERNVSDSNMIVIGGTNVDFIAKGKSKSLLFGQTNPGSVLRSFGGVGRNIADCVSRLGHKPLFISAIGTDSHSDSLLNHCKHMNTSAIARLQDQTTATYCALMTESGELSLGLGDMDIHQKISKQHVSVYITLHSFSFRNVPLSPALIHTQLFSVHLLVRNTTETISDQNNFHVQVSQYEEKLSVATLVVVDGNIPVSTIDYVCSLAKKHTVPVWFEPSDADKAYKPFLSESWKSLCYTSPNLAELCTMNQALGLPTPAEIPNTLEEVLSLAVALSRPLLEHLHCVVVTLGPLGLLVCGDHEGGTVNIQPRTSRTKGRLCAVHYPVLAMTSQEIVNVSGAGDSLAGGIISGILLGWDTDSCVRMGLLAARLSLASAHPIAPTLTLDSVNPVKFHSQTWSKPTFMWMES